MTNFVKFFALIQYGYLSNKILINILISIILIYLMFGSYHRSMYAKYTVYAMPKVQLKGAL